MSDSDLVTVRFLEMDSPEFLRPYEYRPPGVKFVQAVTELPRTAQECYRTVGADWQWRENLHWELDDWRDLLEEEQGELWLAREAHNFVGYAQLARKGNAVEIHYLGLAPAYIGKGLGGWLLTRAVERSWAMGASKVLLNTCSLDAASALPNYLARGFKIVREESRTRKASNGSDKPQA